MAAIVLDGITKRFPDGTTAVRGLDLSIADGELMVLVGPSGCGKTTALRMVAGLEEVTGGTILIDGQPVNDTEPRDRDIAMVFQSYALYPHLSVYDNMAFSLKYRKTPKAEIRRRVEEAARVLELEPLLARKPRQLSGGQRQRVAMGRAIVRQPRAFLMDEPLSNLDAKLRVQMRAEIARLQRSLGVTTIYVTHDQTEAMTLGNRVAVLQHGVLQQVAPPQELYKRPANLFVASFIGSPAMNLLEATVERGDGGPQVCFGTHRLTVGEQAVREHPALEDYLGRKVILGIRPEHLEDAALVPDAAPGSILDVQVELREELGSEVDVHCGLGGEVGSRPVERGEVGSRPVERGEVGSRPVERGVVGSGLTVGVEPLHPVAVDEPADPEAVEVQPLSAAIVARMDPRTTLTESQTAKVHVDLSALHFFDPETGESLREAP